MLLYVAFYELGCLLLLSHNREFERRPPVDPRLRYVCSCREKDADHLSVPIEGGQSKRSV